MTNTLCRGKHDQPALDRSACQARPPPALLVPPAEVQQPVRLPLTPLGIPCEPPPLPMLPAFLFTTLPEAAVRDEPAAKEVREKPAAKEDAAEVKPSGGDWTPVEEIETRMDRRTFFHTDGKTHTFHNQQPVKNAENVEIGARVTIPVEDVHFGNPRIKVMSGAPAPMPTMLKWPPEKFSEHHLQCAQISFGPQYRVWCAVGIPANRLLYAMKRCGVQIAEAEVVEPPPLASPDEDVDLTYGNSIQGIQLVP